MAVLLSLVSFARVQGGANGYDLACYDMIKGINGIASVNWVTIQLFRWFHSHLPSAYLLQSLLNAFILHSLFINMLRFNLSQFNVLRATYEQQQQKNSYIFIMVTFILTTIFPWNLSLGINFYIFIYFCALIPNDFFIHLIVPWTLIFQLVLCY